MIRTSSSTERGWNILLVASLVAIGITAWFSQRPAPSLAGGASFNRDLDKLESGARTTEAQARELRNSARERTWSEDPDAMGSAALEALNRQAQTHHLQLSFRSEKPVEMANMQAAPFVTVLTGAFGDVLAFLGDLEGPKSKLAVNLLQVTASDAEADQVTATVGLVGFRLKEGR